jgi:Tol biopolymer transport system component
MPSWAADGAAIYYVHTQQDAGLYPAQGSVRRYTLQVPSLVRVGAGDGAAPQTLLSGGYRTSRYNWFFFIRQPAPQPGGNQVVALTDGPDPTKSDVVLKSIDLATSKLTSLNLPETAPFGHQDPAWRPDGGMLAYVRPGRDGSRGAATIWRYDVASKKATALTGPGYLEPSYSPDGRYLAATRSDSYGTDIVILDASNGRELLRLTSDERSFAPAWSPAGNAIAFLRIDSGVVDLVMVPVQQAGATWAAGDPLALTNAAGLDAGSRPTWFIPPEEMPKPTAAPTEVGTSGPAASGGPAGTSGPAASGGPAGSGR